MAVARTRALAFALTRIRTGTGPQLPARVRLYRCLSAGSDSGKERTQRVLVKRRHFLRVLTYMTAGRAGMGPER